MDSNTPRKRLTDILNGGTDSLRSQWAATEAAGDFKPLPGGTYTARIISGELSKAKTGTPGYKLAFRVLDGAHTGRQFWHDIWLTPAALPMAKRDLAKIGVQTLDQLEGPIPPGIRCAVKLTLRKEDDGTEHNKVKSFTVLGIDTDPTADPDFAPEPATQSDGAAMKPPTPKVTQSDALDDGNAAGDGSLLPPVDPPSPMEAGQ